MRNPEEHSSIDEVIAAANRIILGKDTQIRLALACLLAHGHLLIEDLGSTPRPAVLTHPVYQ
jgi:MoxR-like ATPase